MQDGSTLADPVDQIGTEFHYGWVENWLTEQFDHSLDQELAACAQIVPQKIRQLAADTLATLSKANASIQSRCAPSADFNPTLARCPEIPVPSLFKQTAWRQSGEELGARAQPDPGEIRELATGTRVAVRNANARMPSLFAPSAELNSSFLRCALMTTPSLIERELRDPICDELRACARRDMLEIRQLASRVISALRQANSSMQPRAIAHAELLLTVFERARPQKSPRLSQLRESWRQSADPERVEVLDPYDWELSTQRTSLRLEIQSVIGMADPHFEVLWDRIISRCWRRLCPAPPPIHIDVDSLLQSSLRQLRACAERAVWGLDGYGY